MPRNVINPFFWVAFVVIFAGYGFVSRYAVRVEMSVGRDVYKFEIE
jgi:hypothetical protein